VTLDQSTLSLLFAGALLIAVFVGIILVWRLARRGGSSSAVVLLGATYEFYNADQRAAVETVVEHAAGKQEEVQPSGDPPTP
jgi:uncharacterized protein (DUF58 family)